MRIRWFRVLSAVGVLAVLPLAAVVATAPDTAVVASPHGGTRDCVSGEVIGLAAQAPSAILDAARCREVGPTPHLQVMDGFTAAQRALEAARDKAPAEGLQDALDLWELGVAQGRNDHVLGGMVGLAMGLQAADLVDELITDPTLTVHDLDAAARRLGRLSHATWDMEALARNDEAVAWDYSWSLTEDISVGPWVVRMIWDSRVAVPRMVAEGPTIHDIDALNEAFGGPTVSVLLDGLSDSTHLRGRAAVFASAIRLRLADCREPADWADAPERDPITGGAPVDLRPELCVAASPGVPSRQRAILASGRVSN